MRFLPTCALALSLTALPAFAQSSPSSNSTPAVQPADSTSVDYAALHENLSRQNKTLESEVNAQRAVVKRNMELLKEAQRLDAANKRLEAEKKKLEIQNTDLEKQRAALSAAQQKDAAAAQATPAPNTTASVAAN